jgi:hypothetical protein
VEILMRASFIIALDSFYDALKKTFEVLKMFRIV